MKPDGKLFRRFAMQFYLVSVTLAGIYALAHYLRLQSEPLPLRILWMAVGTGLLALAILIQRSRIRNGTDRPAGRSGKHEKTAEIAAAALMVAAGAVLRFLIIRNLPMQPKSDFEVYYRMADMLSRGTLSEEGAWYCDYVSTFPHVLGYPAVLSVVFRIFGTGIFAAQAFNLLLQMLACLLTWRTARLLGGRLSGLIALGITAFLPSTILYSNILGSEALFTCLLMTGVWLFTRLTTLHAGPQRANPWISLSGLILLGLVLAFSSFVRPMGIIFLIAAVICILTIGRNGKEDPEQKKTLPERLTDRRWKQSMILVAVYFLGSFLLSSYTARTIRREPAGASVSFGYNLLVGLNRQASGAWNPEDAEYLQAGLDSLGTATAAQKACRDLAFERLKNVEGLSSLLVEKFKYLWGNDDYGATWNIAFLGEQGQLTPERNSFLNVMTDISDIWYIFLLLGAWYCGRIMRRREPDAGYALILTFCGTVALHLLVEQQNRYHYYALYLLAVLAGVGFHLLVRSFSVWITARREKV